jgi:hypothetical protein
MLCCLDVLSGVMPSHALHYRSACVSWLCLFCFVGGVVVVPCSRVSAIEFVACSVLSMMQCEMPLCVHVFGL